MADEAVGMDVSQAMLDEASVNCIDFGVSNVSLLKADDTLSALTGSFDLIHSFIVLQHIPVERVRVIFANMLKYLNAGGVGVIHVTYARTKYDVHYGVRPERSWLVKTWKALVEPIKKILKSNKKDPEMQMNIHILNHLYYSLQTSGIQSVTAEFTDHGGYLGVLLYFQKP